MQQLVAAVQHPIPQPPHPPGSPLGPDGIRPTATPGVYLVPSRSRFERDGLRHTVDAIAETCSCEDWTFRRSKLPAGTALHPNLERRCDHLALMLGTPLIALPAPLVGRHGTVSPAALSDAEPDGAPSIVPAFPCRACGKPAIPLYRLELCGTCGFSEEVFG